MDLTLLSWRAVAPRVLPLVFATCLIAALAGCSTMSDIPAEDVYQPPAPGAPVAYLQGSSIKEDGLFGSEHRGFASMVDLKSIPDAADHWNEPIALSPGKRTIAVEYRYSNFMTRAYVAFDARPGVHYQLMIKNNRDNSPEARMFNDFWIVNLSTGAAVTPVYHKQVTGGKKGTLFYQNK